MIQFIKYDFNHSIHHSSAYILNDTPPGSAIFLSKEFAFYLKLNIKLSSKNKISPFSIENESINGKSAKKIYDFDNTDVVKKSKVFFNSHTLIEAFVVDSVFEMLENNKCKGFLIATNNIYRANQGRKWNVDFEIENDLTFKKTIEDLTYTLHFNEAYKTQKKETVRFATLDKVFEWKFALIKSNNAIESKIIMERLKDLTMYSEFKSFAHEKNLQFICVDKDDLPHHFEPLFSKQKQKSL